MQVGSADSDADAEIVGFVEPNTTKINSFNEAQDFLDHFETIACENALDIVPQIF